ncbi:MAG: bifunctional homocysteine S-methyltransferase/methylenetetrahydrofolate reductase [Firmicutes bacterium HGW-Firmicutes-12]|nr:MAG: bifunctional homocysteine S-methyltransferase/methylenetetrahydrofolate reductase [Firmicutes bacterium HGW-Firmicutes-12]
MIRDYLKNNVLITDGAMGTYYAQVTGKYNATPEFANLNEPEIIEKIHKEYISAGAKLIKTNTFSANSMVLDIPFLQVKKIIQAGVQIANKAAQGKNIFVAASIGPLPETIDKIDLDYEVVINEYKNIVDVFLDMKVKIIIFETFSDAHYLLETVKHIKAKDSSVFVVTQFAINPEGYTRRGINSKSILKEVENYKNIDAYGFNCSVGPGHMYNYLKKKSFTGVMAVAPNAGYPEIIHERTVYIQNPDYFAEKMKDISKLGVKILGGCCGTTPAHIEKMVEMIKPIPEICVDEQKATERIKPYIYEKKTDGLTEKIKKGRFVIAVELDPPFNAEVELIMHNARICKDNGVDLITVADSPMGRARVDSIMMAARIKREAGIEAMPHVCCRDRNLNALKSALLAGYIENIRNVLAVTGDPVATADKNDIKEVFNLNSFKLMELISIMNKEQFSEEPLNIAGALNLNAVKPEIELGRMLKKIDRGANFFLTQPIYDEAIINLLSGIEEQNRMKILGGIMPVVSYRNAQFLNNEVAGIRIPEEIIAKFNPDMRREEAEDLGIEIAVDIAKRMKDRVGGFYFITPFNRVEMIIKIIRRL